MKLYKKLAIFLALAAIASIALFVIGAKNEGRNNSMPHGNGSSTAGLQIISQVFRDGAPIPVQYTCKGQNVSPPLNIMNVPKGAQSLALIMHDPDAPVGDYVHWTMWDIPTRTETIAVNSVPMGAIQ